MSHNTRSKKRKMTEPHGDNCKVNEEEGKPSDPKNTCVCIASASGDNSNDSNHQYVAILYDLLEKNENSTVLHTQSCDMGDLWTNAYPIPLSKHSFKPIRTGNSFYDKFIPDLQEIGYHPLQLVAKGRSGVIILAQDLNNGTFGFRSNEYKPVVLKLFSGRKKKSKIPGDDFITEETAIHQSLDHPNVVSVINHICFHDRKGIVLEYCHSGNLEQFLRAQDARFVTEIIAQRYFKQLMDALEYIHICGICHRDICTHNILITSNNLLKLTDFGHALRYMSGDPMVKDNCGTLGFQAPEIVCRIPYNPRLIDMFSLGSVLYTMVIGHLPFGRIRTPEMARNLKRLEFPKESVLFLSNGIKELLLGLLAYIPESRFSLNRTKHCDWFHKKTERVQIGNFYLVRQPKKIFEGDRERELKCLYDI
ncbi:hypothetical protein SNE40_021295 [Patella caerulea]|uniref:Protein kinase domain-containing protein n=1 Tax=Patella caerulea TaxID=87958 RepID=A0AAN8GIL3_PATCE